MPLARVLSVLVAGLCALLIYQRDGGKSALVFSIALAPILSIIWYSNIWATYIIPFGWMASRASDAKQPMPTAPVACIGWILLLLLLYALL